MRWDARMEWLFFHLRICHIIARVLWECCRFITAILLPQRIRSELILNCYCFQLRSIASSRAPDFFSLCIFWNPLKCLVVYGIPTAEGFYRRYYFYLRRGCGCANWNRSKSVCRSWRTLIIREAYADVYFVPEPGVLMAINSPARQVCARSVRTSAFTPH